MEGMRTALLLTAAVLFCAKSDRAGAQSAISPDYSCKKIGRAVRTVATSVTFNDFGATDNVVLTGIAENRLCQSDSPFQWKTSVAVDRVKTSGEHTTAGRVGLGGFYWWDITPDARTPGINSSLGIGGNAYFGYEDYSFVDYRNSPMGVRTRGKRATIVTDAFTIYTIQNNSGQKAFPPSDTALRLETHLKYINKRAPNAGLPDFLRESFMTASADAAIDIYAPIGRYGSKIQVNGGYERFLTGRYSIRDVKTVALQWRPQRNPDLDLPDWLAITATYRFARSFSGATFGLSVAF